MSSGVPPVVEPKQVQYSTSYANAHSAQKNAGRVAPRREAAPQKLKRRQKPVAAPAAAASSDDSSAESKTATPAGGLPPRGRAFVKSVMSGDTIVLTTANAAPGTVCPEHLLVLSGVSAPRLQRGRKGQDEPYAWQAREVLRKLCVGQVVDFVVEHRDAKSGRAYGAVRANGQDAGLAVIQAGFALAKDASRDKAKLDEARTRLVEAHNAAKAAGLGVHSKKTKHTQRSVNNDVDAAQLVKGLRAHGRAIPALVEYVREGSTLRVELPAAALKHRVIMVYLSGVQCPRVATPNAPAGVKSEPYGNEARAFVERLMLQRDCGLFVEGCDKTGNIFGSIDFPLGNISVQLLKHGYARYIPWSGQYAANPAELQAAEQHAKANKLGIWRQGGGNAGGPRNMPLPGGDSFDARVASVHSGDSITVEDKTGALTRVYLASVMAPRAGVRGGPSEPFADEAREWLRRRLIGKAVLVAVEYRRPGRDNMAARVHVSVKLDGVDVSEQLIRAGLATVARHRVEDPRAANYGELVLIESEAKAQKNGMHGDAQRKPRTLRDFTRPAPGEADGDRESTQRAQIARAKGFLPQVTKGEEAAVVEHVFSSSRFKLRLARHNAMIIFLLGGVRTALPSSTKRKQAARARKAAAAAGDDDGESANAGQSDAKSSSGEPSVGDLALKYVSSLVHQRDVKITVNGMDKRDSFIGTLRINGQDLALSLIARGLGSAFITSSMSEDTVARYRAAEEGAKEKRLNMWKDWTPPAPVVEAGDDAQAEEEEKVPSGKDSLMNVVVTEIVTPSDFYVQVAGDEGLEYVQGKMDAYDPSKVDASGFEPRRGKVAAGKFVDGKWYRVRIDSQTSDGGVRLQFIDFGNSAVLPEESVHPLGDAKLEKLPSLALRCTLAGVKGPSASSDYFDDALDRFTAYVYERKVLGKVMLKDRDHVLHMLLHDESTPDSINQIMLREGLARILARPQRALKDVVAELRREEDSAKSNRYGLWEYGDISDDEEEDPQADRRR